MIPQRWNSIAWPQWWRFEDKCQLGVGFFSKITSRFLNYFLNLLTFKWVFKKCLKLTLKSISNDKNHFHLQTSIQEISISYSHSLTSSIFETNFLKWLSLTLKSVVKNRSSKQLKFWAKIHSQVIIFLKIPPLRSS